MNKLHPVLLSLQVQNRTLKLPLSLLKTSQAILKSSIHCPLKVSLYSEANSDCLDIFSYFIHVTCTNVAFSQNTMGVSLSYKK